MKNKYLVLVILLCLLNAKIAYTQKQAQGKTYYSIEDSLQKELHKQNTTKGKILIIQQLVDNDPSNQNENDYLEQLLKLNDKEKIIDAHPYLVLQQGREYIKSKQTAEAKHVFEQIVTELDRQHKDLTWYLNVIKDQYDALGDQDARLNYFQQKLEYYQVNGPFENTAACYLAIAGYYRYQAAYNQSINYYLRAAEAFKKFTFKTYINQLIVVANEYSDWGNPDRALYYLKISEPYMGNKGFFSLKSGYYYTLGRVYMKSNHYKDAIDAFNEALKSNKDPETQKVRYARGIACSLTDQAIAYTLTDQPKAALQNLQRAQVIIDSAGYHTISSGKLGYLEIDYAFYKYYRQAGDFAKAGQYLLAANQMASRGRNLHFKLIYMKEAAAFNEFEKKPAEALQYYNQYFALLDSTNLKQAKFKIAQYETDQKDKEQQRHINELKQQKVLQDYQISRRNTLLWGLGVVLLLIGGLLVFIYRQLHINKKNLAALKNTQLQLIQSAKMASLGELTAGIAHEIQNPLNFVNNFSEVNTELIEELQHEINNGNIEEAKELAVFIKENEKKIKHHGSRAEFIVKGMLEHSRTSTGERQRTDINMLADEFLKLSYHGLRTKDKSFNAELTTYFEPQLPKINIVQQDLGRVLLNLFNNAFYSVSKKQETAVPGYRPEVSVTTYTENGQLVIRVRDNGLGIPDDIREKIMQPFFTTKPTGEGTGLGLSLSYDIIVKGHNGKILVDSKMGEYADFKIFIPV